MWVEIAYLLLLGALLGLCLALGRAPLAAWARGGAVLLLALAGAAATWRISDPPDALLYADFAKAYRWAGIQALAHPDRLYPFTGEEIRFVNLPIVALLFAPLARLDALSGARILTAAGWLAAALGFWLLAKLAGAGPRAQILLAVALAMNGPLHNSLRLGNTTEFALPLLAGALLCLRRGSDLAAGALLAAAAVLKLPLLVFGVWLAARARARALAAFGATLAGSVALSFLLFGAKPHGDWYRACLEPFLGSSLAAYNVQSIDGFLARLRPEADLASWHLLALSPTEAALRAALVGSLAAACAFVCWRSGPPRGAWALDLEFSLCLVFALVASPISWSHYYLLAWIPLALLLARPCQGGRALAIAAAALVSLPVVAPGPAASLAGRLLASKAFAGGLLLLGLLLRERWRAEPGPAPR